MQCRNARSRSHDALYASGADARNQKLQKGSEEKDTRCEQEVNRIVRLQHAHLPCSWDGARFKISRVAAADGAAKLRIRAIKGSAELRQSAGKAWGSSIQHYTIGFQLLLRAAATSRARHGGSTLHPRLVVTDVTIGRNSFLPNRNGIQSLASAAQILFWSLVRTCEFGVC